MTATPQSNTDLRGIAAAIAAHDDFAICGHVSPDGDCIGSQLAMKLALDAMGKRAVCLKADDKPIDAALDFLPGFDDIVPLLSFEEPFDTLLIVDAPNESRLGSAFALFERAQASILVDHHAVDERLADYSYTDADAASASSLVWELIGLMDIERTPDIATCCYTGLVTDTGGFRFQNASLKAFQDAAEMISAGADPSYVASMVYMRKSFAALQLEERALSRLEMLYDGAVALSWIDDADNAETGADPGDSEGLIDVLRAIKGVRIACLLKVTKDSVRVSLRAKDASDVAAIARELGGGGHVSAAGATVPGGREPLLDRLIPLLGAAL